MHATMRFHSMRIRFPGGRFGKYGRFAPVLNLSPRASQIRRPPLRCVNAGWFGFPVQTTLPLVPRDIRRFRFRTQHPRAPLLRHSVRDPLENAYGGRARARTRTARAFPRCIALTPPPRVSRARARARASLGYERDGGDTERRKRGKPVRERVSWCSRGNTVLRRIFTTAVSGSRQNRKSNPIFMFPVARPTTTWSRFRHTLFVLRPTCLYWNIKFSSSSPPCSVWCVAAEIG